jgi:dTDP-4-dehydrorhamnose 3,5-epimerase
MRIERTTIDGLVVLGWDVAEDARGSLARTFCRAELAEAGIAFEVAQANLSRNPSLHTLRGLHYQQPPHAEAKIVSCLAGRIWDVAVDLRRDSPTYLQWQAFDLSPESARALYIAPGLAHGFLTLAPDSAVHYVMDAAYAPAAAAGICWDDPALDIDWPAAPSLISERDRNLPRIADSG